MNKSDWKKLDTKISQFSKDDKGWKCEICGRSKEQGWAIHHHHFIGRKHTSTRWLNENIFVVCYLCHQKFENDPIWAVSTAKDMRGTKWFNQLKILKEKINKKSYEQNLELMDKSLEEVLKSYSA